MKDAESWAEFFNRVKECIVNCGKQLVGQFEDDSRRLDQQRLMPGWNYCQYFILKVRSYFFQIL